MSESDGVMRAATRDDESQPWRMAPELKARLREDGDTRTDAELDAVANQVCMENDEAAALQRKLLRTFLPIEPGITDEQTAATEEIADHRLCTHVLRILAIDYVELLNDVAVLAGIDSDSLEAAFDAERISRGGDIGFAVVRALKGRHGDG